MFNLAKNKKAQCMDQLINILFRNVLIDMFFNFLVEQLGEDNIEILIKNGVKLTLSFRAININDIVNQNYININTIIMPKDNSTLIEPNVRKVIGEIFKCQYQVRMLENLKCDKNKFVIEINSVEKYPVDNDVTSSIRKTKTFLL